MSLHLEFEPHSWYMGWAIQKDTAEDMDDTLFTVWRGYSANGNTYRVDELHALTLSDLKLEIKAYHLQAMNGYGERIAKARLEYLRGELQAERMSWGESSELTSLAPYIDKNDVELLEAAGVPEHE